VRIIHEEPCPSSSASDDVPVVRVNNALWEMTGHCVDDKDGDWFLLLQTGGTSNVSVEITLEQQFNQSKCCQVFSQKQTFLFPIVGVSNTMFSCAHN
jgi:hypothetical protein